ncbi:hypothetical protein EDC40_103688 [Aminobacter aminovorans]|uniref:Uncharacterized protein n=1 Tax=Aminobacter aminovorans TaxID=83263 RepID=A0A380WKJ3_AMIAI|nr:hypothetical protein [Aminobacter aminovorans]TCS28219.1 hypothetical protein EDC40_103688 [Aminobacter aminovorans]SUU89370.1 Uncharacterised protein [Aminobacter aminovorans]
MAYREPLTEDLDRKAGARAYAGMSHSPERRADSDIASYVQAVNSLWALLAQKADSPEKVTFAEERTEQYRLGYVRWQNIVWAAYSRCMSPMIVGPARFPVDRNRKRMDTYDRRTNEMWAWSTKFAAQALKAIQKIGEPEPVRDPNAPAGCETVELNGVQIVKNYDLDRVQILFGGKPDPDTIKALMGSAWNWSPRNSAWQRKLTPAAFNSARLIVEAA